MLDVSRSQPPAALDAVFFALSDRTRRGLLGRLRGVELTAGALADGFAVTRPAVSRHLRILREAQLVSERRRGRERVYTLTPEPLAGATTWLDEYRTFWAARLHELKAFIEALPDDDPALQGSAAKAIVRFPDDEARRIEIAAAAAAADLPSRPARVGPAAAAAAAALASASPSPASSAPADPPSDSPSTPSPSTSSSNPSGSPR